MNSFRLSRKLVLGIALAVPAGGCGSGPPADGIRVMDAYEGEQLPEMTWAEPSPLARHREIPVLHPPEVFAVYVPAQVSRSRDVLIGDHWMFLKLTDARWFPEKREPTLRAVREAGPEEIRELRRAFVGGMGRMIVPLEEETNPTPGREEENPSEAR